MLGLLFYFNAMRRNVGALAPTGMQVMGFQNIMWTFLYKYIQNVRVPPHICCIQQLP